MGDVNCLEDIDLSAKEMRIGDKMLCLHTLPTPTTCPAKSAPTTDMSVCQLTARIVG